MTQRNGIEKSGTWNLVGMENFSIGVLEIAGQEIGFWQGDMIERHGRPLQSCRNVLNPSESGNS